MGGEKMRRPLLPTLLLHLTLAILLSKYIWRSKLQRPYLQIFREAQVPMEDSPTRFQRGVDPADEGREADMRMIFDKLKREMRAAMEENEKTRSSYQIKPYRRFLRV